MNDAVPAPTPAPAPRKRARVRAPELIGKGGWLNTGGKELTLADLRGSIVDPGLLDLLLHQLPARPGRAAGAGGEAPGHGGDHRRALAEVRARGGAPGGRGRRRAVRRGAPGARRPGAGHLEAVRGAGLADAGGDRPRGLRGRPARRRGARARDREAGRGAGGRARGQGHPAPRRRAVRGARAGADHAALPRQGAAAARRGTSWSATPPGTSSWSWRRTGRAWCGGSAPARAASRTAAETAPFSEPQGLALLRRTARWSSPTP